MWEISNRHTKATRLSFFFFCFLRDSRFRFSLHIILMCCLLLFFDDLSTYDDYYSMVLTYCAWDTNRFSISSIVISLLISASLWICEIFENFQFSIKKWCCRKVVSSAINQKPPHIWTRNRMLHSLTEIIDFI